jgi:hypothetical protein
VADRITVTWQISDGYVGGSRPQSFEVDPEDFIGMSRAEVERTLDQMAVEDMMTKVSAYISGEDEIINRIIEAAESAEAES